MTQIIQNVAVDNISQGSAHPLAVRQSFTIAVLAFLTVVDLFAAQAILPALTSRYQVMPADMAVAVNASTFGMAVASLAVACFGSRLDRRAAVVFALSLLAIPTALLAHADNLTTFATLRVVQGLLMASAFGFTLAYLGESLSKADAANAFAAYITGNVASNLVGRFIAASLTEHWGLVETFYALAALNLFGAALAYATIGRVPPVVQTGASTSQMSLSRLRAHVGNRNLRAAYGIGFLILFAFIGTFSFVNFVLMRPPLSVGMMSVGFVYFVFLPSIVTTGFAGRAAVWFGERRTLWASLAIAGSGLPLLLSPSLAVVLCGMALVALGTFFAQATASGYASRAAEFDRGAASALYLASYFSGGIVGSAVLGMLFDARGWPATVAGIGWALAAAGLLTATLEETTKITSTHEEMPCCR